MSEKLSADRRTVLAALGGATLLTTMGRQVRAEEAKADGHGITVTKEDKPKSSALKKHKDLKKTNDVEVVDYELLGGPAVFRGQVWVYIKEHEKTFTHGEVSKGPKDGMFEGAYYLTKDEPNWFAYHPKATPRHALWVQLVLEKDHGWLWHRFGRKRLIGSGWVWYPWERPIVAW